MGYNFLYIIGLWWHGLKQTILYYIPLLRPERESTLVPTWFVASLPEWLWTYYLDSDRRPTETWLYNYRYAANLVFQSWLESLKTTAISAAITIVWGWTGAVKYGYTTFSDWLTAIRTRVGTWVPYWTSSVASGLEFLYLKLPPSIRHSLSSWDEIFTNIKQSVKDWVIERYDQALSNLNTVWTWIQTIGVGLKNWFDDINVWLSGLRVNFAAVVFGVLGSAWLRLLLFDKDALQYYYNLWGVYRSILAAFLDDPLGYLYDRIENFLVNKW